MSAAFDILLQDWHERLREWSAAGSLASAARHALELEGEQPLLDELVAQWAAGDFSSLPPIIFLPASAMPGAAGAYAISTVTIYLNQDWLETASDDRVIAVITEELGHHLDGLLNEADTPGDEGEVLARNLISIELGSLETKLPDNKQIHAAGKDKDLAVEASSLEWYSPAYQLSDLAWGDVDFNEEADLLTVSLWERQWSGLSSANGPLNPDIEAEVSLKNLNSIYIPYDLANTALTFYGSSSAPTDDELWWSDNNTDSSSLIADIDTSYNYSDVKWEVARVSTYNNQSFDDWEIKEIDNYILDSKNIDHWGWDYHDWESLPPSLETWSSLDVSGINWSTVDRGDYYPRLPFYELGKGDLLYLSPTASGSSYGGYGSAFGTYPVLRVAAQQTGGEEAQVLIKDIGSVYFDGVYGGPDEPAWVAPPSAPDLHPDHDSGISDSDNLTNDSTPRFTGTHEQSGTTIELLANGASLGTAISEYGSNPADWSLSVKPSVELADGTYSIIAKSTDPGSNTSSDSSALLITIDTLAPVFSSTAKAITIDENSGTNQVIYTALATDDNSVSYSLKKENNDDASFFYINSATGEVTLTPDIDHESQSSYALTVVATDAAGNSTQQAVSLAINDLDETPPNTASTDLSLSASAFDENIAAGSAVGTLSTTDSDSGDTFTYSLVSGTGDADNSAFTIVGDQLNINASPDYETKSSYSVLVRSTDAGGLTFDKVLALTVNDINEDPTDLSISASTFNENIAAGSAVGTLSTTDSDSGDTFTYSLVSGTGDTDNSAFTIVGDQLNINASPDYETKSPYSIRVRTTDAGGLTFNKVLALTVNDINEDPTDLSLSASAFNENITAGTAVGTFSTTDSDSGDTFTYSLASGTGDTDNSAFTIVGDQLKIVDSPDFETKSSYSIRVQTKDSGCLTFEKVLGLKTKNLNENNNPIITFEYNSNHSSTDKVVGRVGVTGTEISYSLSLATGEGSDDNYLFYVDKGNLFTNLDPQNVLISTIFKEKSTYSILLRGSRYGYDPIYKNLTFTYADGTFSYLGDDSSNGPVKVDPSNGESGKTLNVNFNRNTNFSKDDNSIGTIEVNNIDESQAFDINIVNQDLGDTVINQKFYVENKTIYINNSDLLQQLLEERGPQALSIFIEIETDSKDKAYQEIKFDNTGEQLKLVQLIDRTEELIEKLKTLIGAIHRFYNSQSGVHFYTSSNEEKENVMNNPDWGYQYEGVAYQALADGGVELFRFYNSANQYHFLTKSPEEALAIIRNSVGENFDLITGVGQEPVSGGWGYKYEGRTYRVADDMTKEYSTPVYRFFQPQKSVHFYSSSLDEVKNVIKMSSGEQYMNDIDDALNAPLLENGWGYQLEGVAWWI